MKATLKIVLFFCLCYVSLVSSQERKISLDVNPGCIDSRCFSKDTTLVHITAEGSDNIVHQIWDFTRGIPTVIFAITRINSTLNIIWDGAVPIFFNLSESPKYSFAVVINELYEYNDVNDIGEMDDRSPKQVYDLSHLSWSRVSVLNTSQEAMIQMEAYRFKTNNHKWQTGIISVKLDLIPRHDYAQDLPHLIHTANSTLVDIGLANMTTLTRYNSSRFALGMCLLSMDRNNDTMHLSVRKSLDDEHTPGVFEIIEIRTPETYEHNDGGFLQFRPVGYTTKERGVTSSTNIHVSSFNDTATIPKQSTLDLFYKNYDHANLLVQSLVISFGDSNDGFYKATNFTSWSFTIGYGVPPIEGVSFFVIMIITIGLGIPIILGLSGIVYVIVRRCRQNNPRQRLTE